MFDPVRNLDEEIRDLSSLVAASDILRDGLLDTTSLVFVDTDGRLSFSVWLPDVSVAWYEPIFWCLYRRISPAKRWQVEFRNVLNYEWRSRKGAFSGLDQPLGGMRLRGSAIIVETYAGVQLEIMISRLDGSITESTERTEERLFRKVLILCQRPPGE